MFDMSIRSTNVAVLYGANFRSYKTGIHYVHVNNVRYRPMLIDSEQYLITVSRYIEFNPARAEMVDQPSDYSWSSFRRSALGAPIKQVMPHDVYQSLT